jgi:hypothetical protein
VSIGRDVAVKVDNRVGDIAVSSWPYRDHVTGIPVSYTGNPSKVGLNTQREPHFQIDDVGYTT